MASTVRSALTEFPIEVVMWGEDEEGRREYVFNWVGDRAGEDRIFIEWEPDPNLKRSISEVRAAIEI